MLYTKNIADWYDQDILSNFLHYTRENMGDRYEQNDTYICMYWQW